ANHIGRAGLNAVDIQSGKLAGVFAGGGGHVKVDAEFTGDSHPVAGLAFKGEAFFFGLQDAVFNFAEITAALVTNHIGRAGLNAVDIQFGKLAGVFAGGGGRVKVDAEFTGDSHPVAGLAFKGEAFFFGLQDAVFNFAEITAALVTNHIGRAGLNAVDIQFGKLAGVFAGGGGRVKVDAEFTGDSHPVAGLAFKGEAFFFGLQDAVFNFAEITAALVADNIGRAGLNAVDIQFGKLARVFAGGGGHVKVDAEFTGGSHPDAGLAFKREAFFLGLQDAVFNLAEITAALVTNHIGRAGLNAVDIQFGKLAGVLAGGGGHVKVDAEFTGDSHPIAGLSLEEHTSELQSRL